MTCSGNVDPTASVGAVDVVGPQVASVFFPKPVMLGTKRLASYLTRVNRLYAFDWGTR
jgi:hypothetical protein